MAKDVLNRLTGLTTFQQRDEHLARPSWDSVFKYFGPGPPRCLLHEPPSGLTVGKALYGLLVKLTPLHSASPGTVSGELARLLISQQRIDDLVELAQQYTVQLVQGEADPVVG